MEKECERPAGSFPLGAWFHEHLGILATLAADERRALNALRELARRAAEFDQAPGESRPPQVRRNQTPTKTGQRDAVVDITGRPHALSAVYAKARRDNAPLACILQRADGWSARVDTSTTKLAFVQHEAATVLQAAIEEAVRAGEAAWGSTGPVHFAIGGLPDEETARSWAADLYRETREHLGNWVGYYGFEVVR
ncbi:hypothetical protein [Streptomyces sp. SBT349]|uniref:hypothetical protein n=1 Tax=Streptomyces sp. SBT349 TaxID=1580539 RepID=UPI00066E88C0|nr:hypothetical protein [Streptomyces sp. SBT349]